MKKVILIAAAVLICGAIAYEVNSSYEDYMFRSRVQKAMLYGIQLGAALDQHRLSTKRVATSANDLGMPMPGEVSAVSIETQDRVAVTLSLRRVAGQQLVFVATGPDGPDRTWKCMSRNVLLIYLPSSCHDIYREPS